jgi:hypothetical protein
MGPFKTMEAVKFEASKRTPLWPRSMEKPNRKEKRKTNATCPIKH